MATLVRKSPQFGWASFALSAWRGTPGYQLLITVRNRAFIRGRTLVPSPWDTEGMLVLTCAALIQELRELADELREAELKCGPGAAKIEQLKAAMKAKDDLLSRLAQPVRPKERFSEFVEF